MHRRHGYDPTHTRLACTLSITGAIALAGTAPTLAQITPDTTLGAESSVVNPGAIVQGNPADLIEGGALRGSNVFHSFIDFNVAEAQRVYFANPNGVNNIVSRVTGGNVSNIFGTLGVDGAANLFLLNPNGILFGPNAQLDVAGSFSASTGDRFTYLDGSEFSAVNPNVAPLVTVNITPGAQLGGIPQGDILNAADLQVGSGQTLALLGDTVVSSGALTASGGTVQVLGNQVNLVDQATIDVSSATGGGNVFVGGEYLGQGSLPTAQRTFVGADATIAADALTVGDGGQVIVWADQATQFNGTITARGGQVSGDGGFVEVSGAQTLGFWGTVDTTAARGNWGTLLLDPADITVVAGATPNPANAADGTWAFAEDTPGNQNIGADAIVALLNTTALTLQATNAITVNAAIDASGNANANTLTLEATTLNLNQNILTEGGQVYNGNVVVGGANISLISDAGAIAFNGTVNGATAGTQSLAVNSSGAIAFSSTVGAATSLNNLTLTSSTGSVSLADSLNISGNLGITAGAGNITDSGPWTVGGNATFTTSAAGADITLDTTSVTGNVSLNTNGAGGDATFTSAGAVDLAASTIGGALNVTATTGSITDSGAVSVGGTGTFTTSASGADITLDTASVSGAVSLNTNGTGGNATFTSGIAVNLATSAIGGALTVTATTGNITDSGAVSVGGTGTFTTSATDADITLDTSNVSGAVSLNTNGTGGNANFTSAGAVDLAASTIGGALNVTATTGNITDSGAVSVGGAGTFTTSAADADITLDTTSVSGAVSLNTNGTGGNANFTSAGAVDLAASTIGGALNVTATTGNITDSGVVSVGGNARFTTNGAGADINLDTTDVTGTVSLNTNGAGGDATITSGAAVDLAASIIGGALTVTAGGAIVDSGNLNVTGNTTLNAAGNNITLDSANNSFGTLALTGNNVSITENAATDLGTSIVTGALSITSQGAITDSGNLSVTGNTTLNAAGNNITLDSANNSFGTLALTGNNVSITENAATDLGTSVVTGTLLVNAQGAITDSGTLTVTGATTLNAGANNITLDDATSTFGTLALIGNNVSIIENAATDLGASTVTGALSITSQGNITDSGAVTVGGTASFTSTQNNADITLDQVTSTGSVSLNTIGATGNATLTSTGAIALAASNVGGNLVVTSTAPAGNVITDSGTVTVGGNASFTTSQTQADILLNTLDVAGTVAVTTAGNNVDVALTGVGTPTATISLGNVSLSGVGSTFTVAAADGITINGGTIATTGTQTYSSPVAIAGVATLQSSGGTLNFQDTLAVNADLTLRAPTIGFGGAVTPTGTPTITLEPFDASANLDVANLGTGQLQDGFGAILIGRTDGTGTVNVGTLSFRDPVTIRSSATGAIAINGALTGTDNASIALSGPTTLNANITTAGQNITFNGATTLGTAGLTVSTGAATAGNITFNSTLAGGGNGLTTEAGSGDLTFSNPVSGLGALIANSVGTTVFNGSVQATSLTTDAGGTTTLNGDVTTTGAQTYGDNVRLNSGVTLTTTNSAITFSGTVDSQAGETNALAINSGTANATFTGAVGATRALAALLVNSAGTTAFNSTVQAASLTTDAGGTTTLNGDVTTTGAQIYGDAVQVNGDLTLTTTNSAVTFSNTVDSQTSETNNLTVTTGNGAVAFNAAVGGAASGELGALVVNTTGTTTFASTVEADSVATNAGGTTVLNGNVTTTGDQTYNDAVTLGADITLAGNDITFNGTLGGAQNLIVNTFDVGIDTGSKTFGDAVADTVTLASLTTNANGTTTLNANVTTTGAQTYNDAAVIVGNDVTLNSNNTAIAFAGTIDSQVGETNDLTINSGTAGTTLNGTIGGTTPLGALNITTGPAIALPTLTVGSLTVDADGVISQQGGSSLTVTGNASFNTQGLLNFGDVNISYSNATLNLGASRIGGDYALLSGDSASVTRLTQSGAVQVAGLSNFNDSDADGVIDDLSALTNAGNRLFTAPVVDGSGNVIVNQSGDVDLSTDIPQTITGNLIITTVGQLDFVGQLAGGAAVNLTSLTNSFGGTVSVNTDVPAEAVVTARILQSNAINGIAVGGTTTLNAIGGSIQADTLSNNFDSDGSGDGVTLNSATAAIADSGALVLAAVNLTGVSPDGLTVTTGGALTNSGVIAVAGDANLTTTGVNADITLNQLNVAGTVTVTTTGANADASLTAAGTPADITLGTVSTTGALAVTATGGIALNGGTVTSGGSQTYNNNVTLGTGTTLNSTGGGVTFGGTVNGAQALAISTATGTTLNGSVGNTTALTGLTITGATTVNTAQVITEATAGDQVFNGPVVLGANATFTGNDITFNGTINSDATARSLTVNSNNSGATTFGGAVGAVSALTSVTTNGDGTVAINGGSVTTTNNQTYNEILTLGANTTLTSTGGAIAFNNTVNGVSDGGQTLTVNGANGVVFGNDTTDIVGGTHRLAALTVTGATTLNGSAITTTGGQDYNSNVTLGTDVTLTSAGSSVTFDGTLNGARNLTVNTATGTVFNNTVGNTTDLTSLTVTGPTTVNTSQIETTGNQTYTGAVAVNTAATLQSGGTLDFQSTLGVNADLILRATAINFGAAVTPSGSPAIALEPLNAGDNLNVAGLGTNQLQNGFRSITIGRGDGTGVVTVGSIGFQDPVVIRSPGGSVVVNGNLTGTDNASFTFTGPTFIGDGSGTSTITIDTSGSSNGFVLFNNAVNAATAGDSLVVTAGSGGITFSNPVGAGPVLGALTATTTGTIGLSGNVTTTNNQTYNGNVVLANTITLNSTAGAIALNGNVNATTAGSQGLTVTTATGTTLGDASGDAVGGTQALSNLTVNGAATLNASVINTTGDQTYNGAATVVNNAALTSTGGVLDFNNTLATTGNLILTGNEIDFTGAVSTSNASNLTLQPATVSQGISVGDNTNNPELNITTGDLNTIQSGFGLLTIGRSDGTGPVTINTSTFNNDVAILGGDITISTNAFIRPAGRNILISGNSVSGQNFTIDPLGLKTGNTAIRARNDIDFTNGLIYGDSLGGGIGGGDVSIISEQGNITLSNQDIISANGGDGAGGNITVRANQGTVTIDAGSRLTTTTQNIGSGGNIAVSGNTLLVAGNSSITSGTGQLFDLSLVGSSNNPGGTGASGDIALTATGTLTLTDSFVSSITRSTAATIAGNISVAGQAITLANSSITAETSNNVEGAGLVTATGLVGRATQGANITFTGTGLSSLTLSNDSLISARGISPRTLPSGLLDAANPNNPTAVAVSDTSVPGGNIFVRGFAQVSGTAAGPRGNDILTSAGGTFGGLIVIDPTVLTGFTIGSGTDFNTLRNNGVNDIASNGEIVTLNLALLFTGPDLEISFVDASGLVGQSCTSASDRSYFRLAGRGGIPSNPTEPLLPSFDQPEWIFLEDDGVPSEQGTILLDQASQALTDLGECYIQRAEGGATLPWL